MTSKRPTFARTRIRLALWSGPSPERPAIQAGGLAVVFFHGQDRGWRVTHVPSGKAIPPYPLSRGQALRFARALLRLGDWEQPEAVVSGVIGLGLKVAAVRKRLRLPKGTA